MKAHYIHHKARILRKTAGYTQKELATLMGLKANSIAKLENNKRDPSVLSLLKMRFIFDHPDKVIVPQIYQKAAQEVFEAALTLKAIHEGKLSPRSVSKLKQLDQILSRITLSNYAN
jgi:transcriptional regulator with XRE-family HTH domain